MNLKAVLEGILFIVGDEGTTINEMVRVLGVNEEEVKNQKDIKYIQYYPLAN